MLKISNLLGKILQLKKGFKDEPLQRKTIIKEICFGGDLESAILTLHKKKFFVKGTLTDI